MEVIRHIRKKVFGATQAEMAAIAGVSQGTISKWETGRHGPGGDALARIRKTAVRRRLKWEDRWLFEPPRA